jgi:hypothetical protein
MTISNYLELQLLDTLDGSGQAYSASATFLKLHLGDPGEDGDDNPAVETTRKAVTFSGASTVSGVGTKTSAGAEWTLVAATETYTHWSMWDDETSGNCLWYGGLSASASVTAGDTFEITSLTLTLE